jgi:hypothetical protein
MSITLEQSQIRNWVSYIPLNASLGIWSLPSAKRSVISDRIIKSSTSRESKLTSLHLVLIGITSVKVHCVKNETQAVGGLSNYKKMYGEELKE